MRRIRKVLLSFVLLVLLLQGCRPIEKAQIPTAAPSHTAILTPLPTFTPTVLLPTAILITTFTPIPPSGIGSLQMIDALNGWAWSDDSPFRRLLFTHDGGETWNDITPSGSGDVNLHPAGAYFVDAKNGWLSEDYLVDPNDLTNPHPASGYVYSKTYFTSDGGKNWTLYPSGPFGGGNNITFKDKLHGWSYMGNGASGHVQLFFSETNDGGKTWGFVPVKSPLPCCYIPTNGLNVLELLNGYIYTLNLPRMYVVESDTDYMKPRGYISLLISSDDGRSWQTRKISLPAEFIDGYVNPIRIDFSNNNDGILVVFLNGSGKTFFYITSDGGLNWKLASGSIYSKSWPQVYIVSSKVIFVMIGSDLYISRDGADSWQKLPQNDVLIKMNDRRITNLDFVDAKNGWIEIWNNLQSPQIYRTIDGGLTWDELVPTILPYAPPTIDIDTSIPTPTLMPTPTP